MAPYNWSFFSLFYLFDSTTKFKHNQYNSFIELVAAYDTVELVATHDAVKLVGADHDKLEAAHDAVAVVAAHDAVEAKLSMMP